MAENPKFQLLFLPVYSPRHNKIETLWHPLYETITSNHRCKTKDELLEQVHHVTESATKFPDGKRRLETVYHIQDHLFSTLYMCYT